MKPNNIQIQTSTETLSAELPQLVLALLGNRLRSFSIELSEEGIVLSGYCDSFHAKQIWRPSNDTSANCPSRALFDKTNALQATIQVVFSLETPIIKCVLTSSLEQSAELTVHADSRNWTDLMDQVAKRTAKENSI